MLHSGMKCSCFIWKGGLWSTLYYAQLKKEHHPYSRQGANFTSDERSDFTSKAIAKRLHKQDFRNWWRCEEKLRFWVKNFYCIKAWREDLHLRWPFFLQKNGRGERSAEPSSVISLFQQIYPLKYAFYLWSTLWSSYCYCDLQNIAHIQQKSNAENSGRNASHIFRYDKRKGLLLTFQVSQQSCGNAEQPNQSKKMFTLCGG